MPKLAWLGGWTSAPGPLPSAALARDAFTPSVPPRVPPQGREVLEGARPPASEGPSQNPSPWGYLGVPCCGLELRRPYSGPQSQCTGGAGGLYAPAWGLGAGAGAGEGGGGPRQSHPCSRPWRKSPTWFCPLGHFRVPLKQPGVTASGQSQASLPSAFRRDSALPAPSSELSPHRKPGSPSLPQQLHQQLPRAHSPHPAGTALETSRVPFPLDQREAQGETWSSRYALVSGVSTLSSLF